MVPPSEPGALPPVEPSPGHALLSDITALLNCGASLEQVFDLIYERLRCQIPFNRIAVALCDERHERLSIVAARSDGRMLLNPGYAGILAGSSLEDLMRDRRPRIINDLEEHLRVKPDSESTRLIVKEGMKSSLTLPLVVQGRPVGVMFFSSRAADTYGIDHVEFLRGIVGQMALAIERSRLMDALREKSDHLENILRNSADAIIVLSRDNRVTAWNEGARSIFGYTEDEIVGKPFALLLPQDRRESGELESIQSRVEKDGYLKDWETVRLTKDGRAITVNVTCTLLRDRRGRIVGRSAIVRDVTHVKKLQDDLIRSRSLAAIGELAATVAHEIKNPLAGISGAIQVLEDAIPRTDARRGVVGEILDQIRRLDNTVRDLLTFARPASPMKGELDVVDSLQRAWSLLAQQPDSERFAFHTRGSDRTLLFADAHLLHQVWLNLFQNAVEGMPRGGTVTADVTDGAPVIVTIRDTGPGIPPHHLAKLFRPFFSTKTRGTGLGLAITRKIVEAHGGAIGIRSEIGLGTTVTVELPKSGPS